MNTPRLIHQGDTVVLYCGDLVITVHHDSEAAYSLLLEGDRASTADVLTVDASDSGGTSARFQF